MASLPAVGKRGDVAIPQGAEVIDAKGKTLLPGLIDGHCHYRDWMGETLSRLRRGHLPEYFQQSGGMDHRAARGREERQRARAARVGVGEHHRRAAAAKAPARSGASAPASSSTAKTKRAKRCAIWSLRASTASSYSSGSNRMSPRRRRTRRTNSAGRCSATRSIFSPRRPTAISPSSIPGRWSTRRFKIRRRKTISTSAACSRKIDTAEVHAHMEPAMFDKIIKVMVDKNVHWSTDLGDLVSAVVESRGEHEEARVDLAEKSAAEISAAVHSQRHRKLLRQVREDGAGKAPGSGGGFQDAAGFRAQVSPPPAARFTPAPIPIMSCPVTRCTPSWRCSSKPA